MKINYNSRELNNNTHMLQVLMTDLFERKPEVRYDQLCNQLRETITVKVIEECHTQRLADKNTHVVVYFKEPAGDFNLIFTMEPNLLKPIAVNAYDEYVKVIGNHVDTLISTLRNEHNLDDVELGEIRVYECHDITKGF